MKLLPATILNIFFSCSIASARLQSLRKLRPTPVNVESPGGTCTRNSDCQATLRTQTTIYTYPVGPAVCDCYGSSSQLPFDECQGEQNCPIAGCAYDTCEGQEAYCQRVSDGSGECALRPVQTNVDKPGGTCSTDSDCHTEIRSMVPPHQDPTGPNCAIVMLPQANSPLMSVKVKLPASRQRVHIICAKDKKYTARL
jgi:hypothetical protein